MFEKMTGKAPDTCPYRAFWTDGCREAIELSKWFETGQIKVRLGDDPPAHLIEGIDAYQSGLSAGRADMYDRQIQELKKQGK